MATIASQATVAVIATPPATPQPATPGPSPSVPRLAPNDAPQIIGLQVANTTVHAGETVSGIVVTSSNVASVEARIASFSIDVPKVGVGRFALSYTVPDLPFFLRKTYPMSVIARNSAGVQAARSIDITIR